MCKNFINCDFEDLKLQHDIKRYKRYKHNSDKILVQSRAIAKERKSEICRIDKFAFALKIRTHSQLVVLKIFR